MVPFKKKNAKNAHKKSNSKTAGSSTPVSTADMYAYEAPCGPLSEMSCKKIWRGAIYKESQRAANKMCWNKT